MTGKEIQNLNVKIEIEVKIKSIEVNKTDIILFLDNNKTLKMRGNGVKNIIHILGIWVDKIQKFYLENDKIVLPAFTFWNLYKGKDYEKIFVSGDRLIEYDGNKYFLANKDYYFPQEKQAVYGIYYDNELWYVGSSSNYLERWSEHDLNFRNKRVKLSKMYGLECESDLIEYKVLALPEEFVQMPGNVKKDMWIIENVEWFLIKKLKPKYNVEGVNGVKFEFRASNLNNLESDAVQEWLENNYYYEG